MTADRPLPNEELNRAILADGIARLEKQLDAAEKRAQEAEASAKEAKSALAEVLLDNARNQKSAPVSGADDASKDQREAQALRAELEAARREIQQQESRLQDARDEAAEELRLEYERRFHAARERMAHEFQKRLSDAKSAFALDAKRQSAKEPAEALYDPGSSLRHETPGGADAEERPIAASLLGVVGARGLEGMRRHAFAIPLAAFAGGLLLGWSALPGRSEPDVVAAKDMLPSVESAPHKPIPVQETASVETTEPAKPTADEPTEPTEPAQAPSLIPPVAEAPPPAVAAPSTSAGPTAGIAEPALLQEANPASAGDRHILQERNTALSTEVDALRQQLDTVSKRAKSAEAALSAERKKTTDLARRAAAAERLREERARADDAPAAKRPQPPELGASGTQETPRTPKHPYRIE